MTSKQRMVYKGVKVLGPITPHRLALRMGYTESAPIANVLVTLRRVGLLEKEGKGKQVKYKINENSSSTKF